MECSSASFQHTVTVDFLEGYALREPTFHRIHAFTEQLAAFAHPASSLSVSLPLIDERRPTPLSNTPHSVRGVLARSYVRLLKQVDAYWEKVGWQLHSFRDKINEAALLPIFQNETCTLSTRVVEVVEETNAICLSATQNLTEPIGKAAYKLLKIEHLQLKKLIRRINDASVLLSHLEAEANPHTESFWPKLSTEGAVAAASTREELSNLIFRVQEVWLKQLELREILRQYWTSANNQHNSSDCSPAEKGVSAPVLSKVAVRKLCQRLRASGSTPSMQCLESIKGTGAPLPKHRHRFTESGESGFVSDSDNVLRRRKWLSLRSLTNAAAPDTAICHRFRSFSFPPSNTQRNECILVTRLSDSPKAESSTSNRMSSIAESTPVRAAHQRAPFGSPTLGRPVFTENRAAIRLLSPLRTKPQQIAVSPIASLRSHINPERDIPLVRTPTTPYSRMCESTFSIISSDDAAEGDSIDAASPGVSPSMEDEVDEDDLSFDPQRRLSRSLPILTEERHVVPPRVLRSPDYSLKGAGDFLEESSAYVPISVLDDDDEANATSEVNLDFGRAVGDAMDSPSLPTWSPLSCKSKDLASLAAALRLSPTHSARLSFMFRDGSSLNAWLSNLEYSLYTPAVTANSFAPCRLRPTIHRPELDRCLSELEFYGRELQCWRSELDELVRNHQQRLAGLEHYADKLLASDHGFLTIVTSWLDMLISRRAEVERELKTQLCMFDFINSANHEAGVKLVEISNQAEPVLTEARCIMDQLRHANGSIDKSCHVYKSTLRPNLSNIPALTERLQDLLEKASELGSYCNLLSCRSAGVIHLSVSSQSSSSLVDNQALRARLRSSLANMHNLIAFTPQTLTSKPPAKSPPQVPSPPPPPPQQQHQDLQQLVLSAVAFGCSHKTLYTVLLFIVLPLLCCLLTYLTSIYRDSAADVAGRSYFASAPSHSVCLKLFSFPSFCPLRYHMQPPPM
ncbi:unnamed protein product [Mesocestoides corti]|uniref:KASH domain-containing protein n=1 Tax=Mesocestoides corti TaxID=53468 RepID=A0A158QUJ5_MESCO|nr:unnamed protein product [Mesocestoides corti]